MKTKTYTFENVIYGYNLSAHGWKFTVGSFNYFNHSQGQETAHKVAHIISGSFKRSNQLDGLARANITHVSH